MYLPTIIIYTISAAVCLTLCLLLLFVNSPLSSTAYKNIKRIQSVEAFLDIMVDIVVIFFCVRGISESERNDFIVPFIVCIQLLLETVVFMKLLHSNAFGLKKVIAWSIVPIILLLIYVCVYVSQYGTGVLKFSNYLTYIGSSLSDTMNNILLVYLVIESLYCFYSFMSQSISFRKELDGIYSGEKVLKGKRLIYISHAFIVFFILAAVDSMIDNTTFDLIFMIINFTVYIFMTICVFNAEYIYSEVHLVEQYKKMSYDKNKAEEYNIMSPPETIEHTSESIINKISAWVQNCSKFYLDDDLSLVKVADDIGLSPRQLSWYLNKVENVNFNNWINRLKIDEAKRIMENREEFSIKEIAYKVGFSSPERMSKVFKTVTGITATEYKNECTASSD